MKQRILIVANQTLGGEELAATVRERVDAGATDLYVVVPVTKPRSDYANNVAADIAIAGTGGGPPSVPDGSAEAAAYQRAEQRLRQAQDRFGGVGITLGGEVGNADAFHAVSLVLSRHQFDEVIVSTLPTGISHWLRTDLASRVHRKFDVPVTTVTARTHQRV